MQPVWRLGIWVWSHRGGLGPRHRVHEPVKAAAPAAERGQSRASGKDSATNTADASLKTQGESGQRFHREQNVSPKEEMGTLNPGNLGFSGNVVTCDPQAR